MSALKILVRGVLLGWVGCALCAQPLTSGISPSEFDANIRVQDDLDLYVNGLWQAKTEIPADQASYGIFNELYDKTQEQLKGLVESSNTGAPGSAARKITDLYQSFMDEARVESLGLAPLHAELARIDALKGHQQLPQLWAHLSDIGVGIPLDIAVHPDNRHSSEYLLDLYQAGLGLPDRDYYLLPDEHFAKARAAYVKHIQKMFELAGTAPAMAATQAKAVVALETKLAKAQWSNVELRDPVKAYNKRPLTALKTLAPQVDVAAFVNALGVKVAAVNVSQPSYVTAMARIVRATPLGDIKAYTRYHLLSSTASYLPKALVDENFAFYGTQLRGVPQNRPRWKRGLGLVEQMVGEALGEQYVKVYFPPEAKTRIDQSVHGLIDAYHKDIDALDWMGPETKLAAHKKLALLMLKIGYPEQFRDYSKLNIVAGDLLGNVLRGRQFESQRQLHKLGKPIDRAEWGMTPQTINAYYNPEMNEIVFPAAILQPPFFDAKADDAANYGSIGAVIGHEISHGFDDQGAQFDELGNLRDWWTPSDHANFKAKGQALVSEYNAFEPVTGFHLNGELTLGENIGDNSGLAIAYKAYVASLGGKPSPVLDGFTGEQRFFLSYAKSWREKSRDEATIEQLKTDPHSTGRYRVLGTVVNQPGFMQAFGLKPGDKLYRDSKDQVLMW
jgi:putative endopeptidase